MVQRVPSGQGLFFVALLQHLQAPPFVVSDDAAVVAAAGHVAAAADFVAAVAGSVAAVAGTVEVVVEAVVLAAVAAVADVFADVVARSSEHAPEKDDKAYLDHLVGMQTCPILPSSGLLRETKYGRHSHTQHARKEASSEGRV